MQTYPAELPKRPAERAFSAKYLILCLNLIQDLILILTEPYRVPYSVGYQIVYAAQHVHRRPVTRNTNLESPIRADRVSIGYPIPYGIG